MQGRDSLRGRASLVACAVHISLLLTINGMVFREVGRHSFLKLSSRARAPGRGPGPGGPGCRVERGVSAVR